MPVLLCLRKEKIKGIDDFKKQIKNDTNVIPLLNGVDPV
jgi:hypothetical protein